MRPVCLSLLNVIFAAKLTQYQVTGNFVCPSGTLNTTIQIVSDKFRDKHCPQHLATFQMFVSSATRALGERTDLAGI